jgi:hypothetical protein
MARAEERAGGSRWADRKQLSLLLIITCDFNVFIIHTSFYPDGVLSWV